jgi:hypothetical protein
MTTISIGIDPGKSGAYAFITESNDGVSQETHPWDEDGFISAMKDIAERAQASDTKVMACLEKVGATPQMGVTSSFSFGRSSGFIEGVLMTLHIPYQKITPQAWKKEHGLIVSKAKLGDSAKKALSISTCKKLFPYTSLKKTERCTTDSDGMAEALLMAEYARSQL